MNWTRNWKSIAILAVLLMAVGVVLASYFNLDIDNEPISVDENGVLVTPLEHNVSFRSTTQSELPLLKETEVFSGSTVITSNTGRALLEFSSSTRAILDFNSELIVEDENEDRQETTLQLLSGQVWSRVEKALEKGEFFEIQTANAVASVRGTSFGVQYKDKEIVVVVEKGEVKLALLDQETGEEIIGSEKIITAGNMGVLSGQTILVQAISLEVKNSRWYKTNTDDRLDSPATKSDIIKPKSDSSLSAPKPTPPRTAPVEEKPAPSPFSFSSVSPAKIEIPQNGNVNITLAGRGFLKLVNVFIGSKPMPNWKIIDDTKIQLSVPSDLGAGIFDVSVVNVSNTLITLSKAFSITIVEQKVEQKPTNTLNQNTDSPNYREDIYYNANTKP